MIEALIKAVIQLSDKAIQKILILSVGLALTVFVALWSLIGFALTQTALLQITWLDLIVDVMGGFGTLLVTWFLFPAILSAIIPLFLESVVHAVETKHYPELPNARGVKLSQSIVSSVRFLLLLVILNVLVVGVPLHV